MTNQELLEKAARAAGIEIEIYTGQSPFHGKLMRRVITRAAATMADL